MMFVNKCLQTAISMNAGELLDECGLLGCNYVQTIMEMGVK